jgi:hypothetical protein
MSKYSEDRAAMIAAQETARAIYDPTAYAMNCVPMDAWDEAAGHFVVEVEGKLAGRWAMIVQAFGTAAMVTHDLLDAKHFDNALRAFEIREMV